MPPLLRPTRLLPALLLLLAPGAAGSDPDPLVLSLEGVRERVASDNELGEIVRARVEQSRARRRQALAGLLPQASAGASASWVDQEVSFGDRAVVNRLDWDASAQASMTVFDGTKYPLYRQRGEEVDVARAQAQWERRLLELEAEETFHTVAAADREVAIAEDMLALRRAHADQAGALAEAGVGLALDVSRAEAELLAAEQRLLEARQTRGNAADALAVLMGMEPGAPIRLEPPGPVPAIPAPEPEHLPRRADFMGLAYDLDALGESHTSALWSLAPKLDIQTRVLFGPSSFSNPDGFVWSATLNATWTLYDGGWRYAEMDRIEAQIRERRLALRRDLRHARAEVQRALRELEAARASARVAERRVAVAREAFEQASARFERGIASSIEVRDAAEALEEARLSLSEERLRKRLMAARYLHLTDVDEESR